jgi:hypothetical protein
MTAPLLFGLVRPELLMAQTVRSRSLECDLAHKLAARSGACVVRVDRNSRFFMFKHASFPAAETRSATIISFPWKRKNLFARVLDAMHQSRRNQARQIVRHYRHLISHEDRPGSARPDDR